MDPRTSHTAAAPSTTVPAAGQPVPATSIDAALLLARAEWMCYDLPAEIAQDLAAVQFLAAIRREDLAERATVRE